MYNFNYQKAGSRDEALSAHSSSDDGTYLAGGMTLIPTLKQRLAQHSDVIDLSGIGDLAGISDDGAVLGEALLQGQKKSPRTFSRPR